MKRIITVIMVATVMGLVMVAVAGPALAILPKRGFVIHDVVAEDGSTLGLTSYGFIPGVDYAASGLAPVNTYVDHPPGF